MKTCPLCMRAYPDEQSYCGVDGTRLEAPVDSDDLSGRIIDGRYRIMELIGKGGMGRVYKVEHVHLGQVFAMKFLRQDLVEGEDLVARFRREAWSTSHIGHDNIIFLTDFGVAPGLGTYFVMEYLEGRSLRQVLRDEAPLPFARALFIIEQICDALAMAHGKGVVHRDLKPDNIFLVRRGTVADFVKVLDFGIAGLVENDHSLTMPGDIMGSPEYMSPEQARGKTVDHRGDIYALGVILYEMLAATVPFKGESVVDILHMHCQDQPPPLPPGLPGGWEEEIMRALHKEPASRHQSTKELARALRQMLSGPAGGGRITREMAIPQENTPSTSIKAAWEEGVTATIKECPPVQDGRRSFAARMEIHFRDLERFQYECQANIRRGGLYVSTSKELPTLSRVQIILIHPLSKDEYVTSGDVVYVARKDHSILGMGLALNPKDQVGLERFLKEDKVVKPSESAIYEPVTGIGTLPSDRKTRYILTHINGKSTVEQLRSLLGEEGEGLVEALRLLESQGFIRRKKGSGEVPSLNPTLLVSAGASSSEVSKAARPFHKRIIR